MNNTPTNRPPRPPKAKDVLEAMHYESPNFDSGEFLTFVAGYFAHHGVTGILMLRPEPLGFFGGDIAKRGFYYPKKGDIRKFEPIHHIIDGRFCDLRCNGTTHDKAIETIAREYSPEMAMLEYIYGASYVRSGSHNCIIDTQYVGNAVAILKINGYSARKSGTFYRIKLL